MIGITQMDIIFFSAFIPFISTFFFMILFHELGHLFYFWLVLKRKVLPRFYFNNKMKFGIKIGFNKDYDLPSKELKNIYLFGVIAGFIPLIIITFYYYNINILIINSFVLMLYLRGCKKDINNIKEINKNEFI